MPLSVATGRHGISVLLGSGAALSPMFQVSQNLSISATVDGTLCTLACDPWHACEPYSLLWGADQYISAADRGTGIQWAHNLIELLSDATSWNRWSPTAQGRQKDGVSAGFSSSNCLERWRSADGRYMRTKIKAAFWADVGQTITTGHPARNVRPLSEMLGVTEHQWGYLGNDHIIQRIHTLTIPSGDPVVRASKGLVACPLTIYVPDTTFGVMEWLNPVTGARTAYPGYPANSNAQTIIMRNTAGTLAIAPFMHLNELGVGMIQGYELPVGNDSAFILPREEPAGDVAAIEGQTRTYHSYICIGRGAAAVTDVVDAVVAIHAAA